MLGASEASVQQPPPWAQLVAAQDWEMTPRANCYAKGTLITHECSHMYRTGTCILRDLKVFCIHSSRRSLYLSREAEEGETDT